MSQATKTPPQTPSPFRPPQLGGGLGRVNWLSALAGFAIGAVMASFAWVGVMNVGAGSSSDQGDRVFLGPQGGDAVQGEEDGEGGTQVIRRGGRGGTAGTEGTEGTAGGGGGVTGNLIKLGATVAEDGIAKDFLGEVRYGMEAVKNKVNAAGGIHGRQLQIIYKQDSWDPPRGQTFITNLIYEERVFALAVSPSSEGLNAASNAGVFIDSGTPVIGADGLNNSQFINLKDYKGVKKGKANPWIWPVAAATTTQVHVMIKDACDRAGGANCADLRPAIVFGNTYRFGVEGSFAFNGAFCRARGGEVNPDGYCNDPAKNIPGFVPGGTTCSSNPPQAGRFCGIEAGKTYTSEINTVRTACQAHGSLGACNFILLLLEPATALTWMGGFDPASSFSVGMAGAQPLFTSNFGVECKTKCHGMYVWTGYNPPIGAYANNPAVAQFVQDIKAASGQQADEFNQFTMGGYIGMKLLVEALDKVGRDLTKDKLVQTLDSMEPLKTGLTNPEGLRWKGDFRYANHSAQSFRIQYPVNRFTGWNPATPYTRDPWLGKDNLLP